MSPKSVNPILFYVQKALGAPAVVWAASAASALFSLILFLRGHAPSFVGWPLPVDTYYGLQAAFLAPLLASGFQLWSRLLQPRTATDGDVDVRRKLAWVFSGALAGVYLSVDVVTYTVGGFAALSKVARMSLPLLGVVWWLGALWAVRTSSPSSWTSTVGRVTGASLLLGVWVGALWR